MSRVQSRRSIGAVAEVPVELSQTEDGWSPYLSVEDVKKLDEVREASVAGI